MYIITCSSSSYKQMLSHLLHESICILLLFYYYMQIREHCFRCRARRKGVAEILNCSNNYRLRSSAEPQRNAPVCCPSLSGRHLSVGLYIVLLVLLKRQRSRRSNTVVYPTPTFCYLLWWLIIHFLSLFYCRRTGWQCGTKIGLRWEYYRSLA